MPYLEKAKRAGVHGTVVLRTVIGKNGKVELAEALGGPDKLFKIAEELIEQGAFRPIQIDGEVVEAETITAITL